MAAAAEAVTDCLVLDLGDGAGDRFRLGRTGLG